MNVTCPKCGAGYDVHADRVPTEGIDMKCSKCLHTFKVYPHGSEAEGVPAAPSADLGLKGVTFLGGDPSGGSQEEASERFFIQRPSGKIFGPFEKHLIVQMLKARKLTGDESVSRDKSFWVPLAAIPDFASLLGQSSTTDTRGETHFHGRPGAASFDIADHQSSAADRSAAELSNLPGLGNDVGDISQFPGVSASPELPAPAGFGAELPAPAGFGAELPAPAGVGAELPAPAGFGAELPAPAGFGAELPAPAGFGAELPAPAGFGAELPAPAGFGAELPAPAGFGAELPAPQGGLEFEEEARLGGRAELSAAPDLAGAGGFSQGPDMASAVIGGQAVDGNASYAPFSPEMSHVRNKSDMRDAGPDAGDFVPAAHAADDFFGDFSAGSGQDGSVSAFGDFGHDHEASRMTPANDNPASFSVEVEHSQAAPMAAANFGNAAAAAELSSIAGDASANAAAQAPETQSAAAAEGGKPSKAKKKKGKKKGGRLGSTALLAVAIVLLSLALLIVVGILVTQFDLLGSASPVAEQAPVEKPKAPVVKPSSDGTIDVALFEPDTHGAYMSTIEQTRKALGSNAKDASLKGQLAVSYALYLAHYPENEQYRTELDAIAGELKGVDTKEARLARGAHAVLSGRHEDAKDKLKKLTKDKRYGQTANLLLGLTGLIEPSKEGDAEEKGDDAEAKGDDAEAKGDDAEAKGDDAEEKGGDAAEEGGEEPAERGGEGGGEEKVADKGDVEEAGEDVEMNLVDEVMAEEGSENERFNEALSYFKRAIKQGRKAPAPHFFAALVERRMGRSDSARRRLKKMLKKAPEHVPGLLEMSMLSYLAGDLDEARNYVQPVAGELSAAASKRERSQAQLLLGLVHVARRQSEEAVKALTESLKIDPSNEAALKALGEEFFRNRRFEEALTYFTTNQGLSQSDPEVMLGVVKSHIGLEQFDEAVEKLEAGVKAFPADARFPFYLGLIHEKEGLWPEARRRYRAAIQIDPDFSKSRVRLALLLARDNKREEAEVLLGEAERRGAAQDADIAVDIGQAYMMMGQQRKALGALQTALKLNASNLDARIRLSRYHLEQGDQEKALELLKPFMETEVLDTELSLLLGDVYRAMGQYERAIEQYDRLIEANPDNPRYLFLRGLAYFGWKNYDTARKQFTRAYALNPKFAEAYFYTGRVHFAERDYGQAIKIFRAVLDEDQANGEYRFFFAFALERSDNPTQALEEYKNVERFAPSYGEENPTLFYRRGRLLAAQGNYRKAKRDLGLALKYDPGHLNALVSLADTYYDERDYERALAFYDRAIEKVSDEELLKRMGRVYFKRGQTQNFLNRQRDAIRSLDRALELGSLGEDEAPVHEMLGRLYKDSGNRGEAVKHFKQYLVLRPDAANKKAIEKQIRFMGGTP